MNKVEKLKELFFKQSGKMPEGNNVCEVLDYMSMHTKQDFKEIEHTFDIDENPGLFKLSDISISRDLVYYFNGFVVSRMRIAFTVASNIAENEILFIGGIKISGHAFRFSSGNCIENEFIFKGIGVMDDGENGGIQLVTKKALTAGEKVSVHVQALSVCSIGGDI